MLFTVLITIFYILWLCAVLLLLWHMWRSNVRYTRRLEQTLVQASLKAAEAANKAADAAHMLAEEIKGKGK